MNLRTITLQIGNSDDKLPQVKWCDYCTATGELVRKFADRVHFAGYPPGCEAWQNACWVFEIESAAVVGLMDVLIALRKRFNQDSIAWTEGVTAFL